MLDLTPHQYISDDACSTLSKGSSTSSLPSSFDDVMSVDDVMSTSIGNLLKTDLSAFQRSVRMQGLREARSEQMQPQGGKGTR